MTFSKTEDFGVLSTDTVLLFSEPNSQRTMCMLQIWNYSWNIRSLVLQALFIFTENSAKFRKCQREQIWATSGSKVNFSNLEQQE